MIKARLEQYKSELQQNVSRIDAAKTHMMGASELDPHRTIILNYLCEQYKKLSSSPALPTSEVAFGGAVDYNRSVQAITNLHRHIR